MPGCTLTRPSSLSPTASSSSPTTSCGTASRIVNSGGDFFERLNADRLTRYHTKRLAALGYTVTLTKDAA